MYAQNYLRNDERKLEIRLWDVGHGLAIWIKTPNGQNHWIDTGKNSDPSFDPAAHVKKTYAVKTIDRLIITHPDTDHYNGIVEFFEAFKVIAFARNKIYINHNRKNSFNTDNACDKKFLDEHDRYNFAIPYDEDPTNKNVNGGVEVKTFQAPYEEGMTTNNSSLVIFYKYANCIFIVPGDIEEKGWTSLYNNQSQQMDELLKNTTHRILVAPHHGRRNGYTQHMIDVIKPTLILISDKASSNETHPKFRDVAAGESVDGTCRKFASTVTSGRIKVTFSEDENINITTAWPRK